MSMIRLTVEETNLLSIYNEGGKRGLMENINAALPFMDEDMRELAKRTLVSARSLFPILFYANGFRPPYFPLISCCMQSFSRPRIKSVVPSAELLLRPPLTASNTARTAGSVLPADRQRSA